MPLPDDPAGFVAAAERGINQRNLKATCAVYAERARLEAVTDGARELHVGSDEIRRAWSGYLGAMDARGFRLRKRMLAAENDTLVNEWSGTLGGRTDAQGVEHWRFDGDGKVYDHRMLTFMNVKPSTSPLQRLRLLAAYPLTAVTFLRETARARR